MSMNPLEFLDKWLRQNPFLGAGQAKLLAFDAEHAVLTLNVYPALLNPGGTVHGGALYTLADDVAGIAAAADGRLYVTQSGALNYLRNQSEGQLRAEATVLHRGFSTCMINVDIYGNDNKLLATGDFNFFIAKKQKGDGTPTE